MKLFKGFYKVSPKGHSNDNSPIWGVSVNDLSKELWRLVKANYHPKCGHVQAEWWIEDEVGFIVAKGRLTSLYTSECRKFFGLWFWFEPDRGWRCVRYFPSGSTRVIRWFNRVFGPEGWKAVERPSGRFGVLVPDGDYPFEPPKELGECPMG